MIFNEMEIYLNVTGHILTKVYPHFKRIFMYSIRTATGGINKDKGTKIDNVRFSESRIIELSGSQNRIQLICFLYAQQIFIVRDY